MLLWGRNVEEAHGNEQNLFLQFLVFLLVTTAFAIN